MKRILVVTSLTILLLYQLSAQNVGIGTSNPHPAAFLHIDLGSNTGKGVLITGDLNAAATTPSLSIGSMFFFSPSKAAIKAGYSYHLVANSEIGPYSTAFGFATKASGSESTAMGSNTVASNNVSTAMGSSTTASGQISTALGNATIASGNFSTAMGSGTTASGGVSTAMGSNSVASGFFSTAIGAEVIASGDYSVAIGKNVSTNAKKGAFFLGDSDPYIKGQIVNGTPDQIAMRFNGGYYFISSNSAADIGVQVVPGGNSWAVISDAKSKENFLPVDSEAFLKKIASFHLTTWNYKTQDPKTFRHYGPMAQDFYAAFGQDDLGSIGCDTLINQQDFLGVGLIAIQALEKRTETLKAENEELKEIVLQMQREVDELKKKKKIKKG